MVPRRRAVLLLAAVFLGPVALSLWLYSCARSLQPRGRSNYGALISPPRPLPELSLATPGGAATAPAWLRGRWSLVQLAPDDCAAGCRQSLRTTRALQLVLGRDQRRVQRVLLIGAACCSGAPLAAEDPALLIARSDDGAGERLLAAFADGTARTDPARIYLVDPLGNLMMSYPAPAERQGLLRDLEQLLRLSAIG